MPALTENVPKLEKSINSEGAVTSRGIVVVLGSSMFEAPEPSDCNSVGEVVSSRLRFLGRPMGFLGE
jgi:hypothetical protein